MALALYPVAEAEARCGSSALSFHDADHAPEAVDPVSREVSPVWNAVAFRRSFPALWGEYLRAHFQSAYAVQKAFPGIDSKTARDWFSGKHNPSGCFVAAVVAHDPHAMEILGRIA